MQPSVRPTRGSRLAVPIPEELAVGPIVDQVVRALTTARDTGRIPAFATIVEEGLGTEHAVKARETSEWLAALFGVEAGRSFPVLTAAEAASQPDFARSDMRRVHLVASGRTTPEMNLADGLFGQGLNAVDAEAPESTELAMVLQTLLAVSEIGGSAAEAADTRSARDFVRRNERFLEAALGEGWQGSEADKADRVLGMFRLADADQLAKVLSTPVLGRALGARLAEALRSWAAVSTSA